MASLWALPQGQGQPLRLGPDRHLKSFAPISAVALNLECGPGSSVRTMRFDQTTELLTVGQLASQAGVRPDTIRYYERAGLLPAPQRTSGDHPRYETAGIDPLLFIRGAQRRGRGLAEIRELLAVRDTGVCACEPAEGMLRRHVAEIDTEMA